MLLALLPLGLSPVLPQESAPTLPEARAGFRTRLVVEHHEQTDLEPPPEDLVRLVTYDAPSGPTSAYLSTFEPGAPRPAIVWITGGFPTARGGSYIWETGPADNEQSATAFREAGAVMLFPTVRGTARNPGTQELMMGEVDDVIAAARYLATVEGVDPERIYLGGHSTGGTLALLVAESTDLFEAVFSFGPESDFENYGVRDAWPFDKEDPREWTLRSPRPFLHGITTPTFLIEGQHGNDGALTRMEADTDNPRISFHVIPGADHFMPLRAVNEHLARRVMASADDEFTIQPGELAGAFRAFWSGERASRDAAQLTAALADGVDEGSLCQLRWTLRTSREQRAKDASMRLSEGGAGSCTITPPASEEDGMFTVTYSVVTALEIGAVRRGSELVAEAAGDLWLQDVGWTARLVD